MPYARLLPRYSDKIKPFLDARLFPLYELSVKTNNFWSRTLNTSENCWASNEKEAAAIVESIRKWFHFLLGRHFTVITDHNSIALMFDKARSNKTKNDKIMRWIIEFKSIFVRPCFFEKVNLTFFQTFIARFLSQYN